MGGFNIMTRIFLYKREIRGSVSEKEVTERVRERAGEKKEKARG